MYYLYSFSVTLFSCFAYRNLNLICDRLITKSSDEKIKLISSIHAISSTIISYLYINHQLSLFYYINLLYTNSIGYFISDTLYLIIYRKTMSNELFWQYIFHHIISVIALLNLQYYPLLIAHGFLTEISTPFFNISWYYYKNKNSIYYVNFSILYYLFIKYRVFGLLFIFNSKHNKDVYSNVVISGIILLNLIWSYKLTVIARKEVKYLFNKYVLFKIK